MPLTCDCLYDGGDFEWYYDAPGVEKPLDTKRAVRCTSCRALIRPGETCVEFTCWRYPAEDTLEERIIGEGTEVWLAPKRMCERCGDLYWSLEELGYCVGPGENMLELAREYGDLQREEREWRRRRGAGR